MHVLCLDMLKLLSEYVQGAHGGGHGLGFVDFASVFHCLPNSAWAGKNWGERAVQLGKIEEHQK